MTEIYKNAPITEAALDIRARLPQGMTTEALEALKDSRYPTLHQRSVKMEVKFIPLELGDVVPPRPETSNTPLGFSYRSSDEKDIFQARTDGFTLNRLSPYLNWNTFSGEAKRLWELYREFTQPAVIELLGLNYVNQIMIPERAPFSEYFRTYLEVAPELPQQVNNFSLGFQCSWPGDSEILLHVAQAVGPQVKEGFVSVVLSIQAFKVLQKTADRVEEMEIWETFEKLRDVKNSTFEACITDLVRKDLR